jgi:hypothetical protein
MSLDQYKAAVRNAAAMLLPPILLSPVLKFLRFFLRIRGRWNLTAQIDPGTAQAINHLESLLRRVSRPLVLRVFVPTLAKDTGVEARTAALNVRLASFNAKIDLSYYDGDSPRQISLKPYEVALVPPLRIKGHWQVTCTEALVNVLRYFALEMAENAGRVSGAESPQADYLISDFEWGDATIKVPRTFRERPAFQAFNVRWGECAPRIYFEIPELRGGGEVGFPSFNQAIYRGTELSTGEDKTSEQAAPPLASQICHGPLSVKVVIPFRDHLELLPPLMKTLAAGVDPAITRELKISVREARRNGSGPATRTFGQA